MSEEIAQSPRVVAQRALCARIGADTAGAPAVQRKKLLEDEASAQWYPRNPRKALQEDGDNAANAVRLPRGHFPAGVMKCLEGTSPTQRYTRSGYPHLSIVFTYVNDQNSVVSIAPYGSHYSVADGANRKVDMTTGDYTEWKDAPDGVKDYPKSEELREEVRKAKEYLQRCADAQLGQEAEERSKRKESETQTEQKQDRMARVKEIQQMIYRALGDSGMSMATDPLVLGALEAGWTPDDQAFVELLKSGRAAKGKDGKGPFVVQLVKGWQPAEEKAFLAGRSATARWLGTEPRDSAAVTSLPPPVQAVPVDRGARGRRVGNGAERRSLDLPSSSAVVQRILSSADFDETVGPNIPAASGALGAEVLRLLMAIEADPGAVESLRALAALLRPLSDCLAGDPEVVARARQAIEETKDEIDGALQILAALEPEEAPLAADVINEKLRTNDFRVTSDLKTYAQTFGEKFTQDRVTLREEQYWFDGGAGLAKAMQEHLRSHGEGKAVAYSAAKPEPSEQVDERDVRDLDGALAQFSERFSYVATGEYFGDIDNSAFGLGDSGFQLITDHNGVMMYTEDLSGDLSKYLRLLAVGGVMHLTLNPVDAVIDGDPNGGVLNWLQDIKGVAVEPGPSRDAWRLKKVDAVVDVPHLGLSAYETVQHSNAPHRKYKR